MTELEHQPGAGMPDAWQRIWMPERMAYIKGEGKEGCPFCHIPSLDDAIIEVSRNIASRQVEPDALNPDELVPEQR